MIEYTNDNSLWYLMRKYFILTHGIIDGAIALEIVKLHKEIIKRLGIE